MKIEIICKEGRWLVNGKRLQDMSRAEMEFMDNFFKVVKIAQAEDNEEVRHYINRKAADQAASINYDRHEKECV